MNAKNSRLFRTITTTFLLAGLTILSAGCDDIAGAMMETAVKNGSKDSPKRNSFAKRLQKVQDECPKEISDTLTLESVALKGINRVEFKYLVSESGRETYNMNNFLMLEPLCLKWTQESPIGPSVIACDLSVKHVFKDADGKQVYSHSVYKKDLKKKSKDDRTAAEAMADAEAAADGEMNVDPLAAVRALGKAVNANALTLQEKMGAAPIQEEVQQDKPEEEEEFQYAEPVKSSARTKTNPAGVRDNPYAKPGTGGVQGNPYGN